MAKPTVQPKWAATATFPTPSTGKQNAGWRTGERPPAQYLNWLFYWIWQWIAWLDAGIVAFADITAATLTTTGNVIVGGTLAVTSTLNAAATTVVSLTCTAAATIGTTLGVTGLFTASGGVTVPTGQAVSLNGTTTLAIGGSVTTDIVLANNKNVQINGTGAYKHTSTETVPIHGSAFQPITSSTTVDYSSNGCMFTGGTGVQAAINVPQGRVISSVNFYIRDSSTGPSVLQCQVTRMDSTGATTGDVSAGSAGNSTDQTITVTPTSTKGNIIAQAAHLLRVFYNSGSAQCRVYLVEVLYTYP